MQIEESYRTQAKLEMTRRMLSLSSTASVTDIAHRIGAQKDVSLLRSLWKVGSTGDLLAATRLACEAEEKKNAPVPNLAAPPLAKWKSWYPKAPSPERGLTLTRDILGLPNGSRVILGERRAAASNDETLRHLRRLAIWSAQSPAEDGSLPRPSDLNVEAVLEQQRQAWNAFEVTANDILEMASVAAGVQSEPRARTTPDQVAASNSIDVTGLEGRNSVERLLSYLKKQPGGDKLDWRDLNKRASELSRDPNVLIYDQTPSTLASRAPVTRPAATAQKRTISLSGCHGRNRVERLQWWIRCNEPGGDKLSWGALNIRSDELARDPNVLIEDDPRA